MSIRSKIISQIENVAAEQKKKIPPLKDDLGLADSGLDSLCFAILVARLEDELGADPFTASDEVYFPKTLGEFIGLYEHGAR
ncbi:MAG: acyl carrier protein [Methylocystis sp.]